MVANAKAPLGEPVVLLVRPERIELGSSDSGINCFPGVVRHVAYMGAYMEYRVEVIEQLMIVQQPATRQQAALSIDTDIMVQWDPEAVVCLGTS